MSRKSVVQIDQTTHQAMRAHAKATGRKLYHVVDEALRGYLAGQARVSDEEILRAVSCATHRGGEWVPDWHGACQIAIERLVGPLPDQGDATDEPQHGWRLPDGRSVQWDAVASEWGIY